MGKAYLLSWNPNKWDFEEGFDAFRLRALNDKNYSLDWAAINSAIQEGDDLFLMRLGESPRGIVAKGIAVSSLHTEEHYDDDLADEGKTAKFVTMKVVSVGDYRNNKYLTWDRLKREFPAQNWTPQSSGIAIKDEYHAQLNEMWDELFVSNTTVANINIPLAPKSIKMDSNGIRIYQCGRCDYSFAAAPRCPECGQLVKDEDL